MRDRIDLLYIDSLVTPRATFIFREILEVSRHRRIRCYSVQRLRASDRDRFSQLPFAVRHPRPVSRLTLRGVRDAYETQGLELVRSLAVVIRLNARRPLVLLKAVYAFFQAMNIVGELRSAGTEVARIHAHYGTTASTVAWVLARALGVPYTFTAHAHDIYLPNQMLPRKLADAQRVVTCTRFNRQLLLEMMSERDRPKLQTIHHGIRLGEFPLPAVRRSRDSEVRLLALGRLVPMKGYVHLLEAVVLLRSVMQVRCEIVGDGPENKRLQRFVSRHDLQRAVAFTSWLPEAGVREAFSGADIFVMPSIRLPSGLMDGLPNVLIESLALGVPVVASRLSGIPELIEHERTGILVNPGKPEELAAAIQRLATDHELSERLRVEGRRRVEERFDISKNAGELLSFVEDGEMCTISVGNGAGGTGFSP